MLCLAILNEAAVDSLISVLYLIYIWLVLFTFLCMNFLFYWSQFIQWNIEPMIQIDCVLLSDFGVRLWFIYLILWMNLVVDIERVTIHPESYYLLGNLFCEPDVNLHFLFFWHEKTEFNHDPFLDQTSYTEKCDQLFQLSTSPIQTATTSRLNGTKSELIMLYIVNSHGNDGINNWYMGSRGMNIQYSAISYEPPTLRQNFRLWESLLVQVWITILTETLAQSWVQIVYHTNELPALD